jgi:hypothetical protein
VPELNILGCDGRLRWDASSLLHSTIMFPENGDQELRRQYAAHLRIVEAKGLPDGGTLLTKRDHILAGKFRARKRIRQTMQTRGIHSILAGAMLWDLHTAVAAHPGVASKSKIEFTIDRISIAEGKTGSLGTVRDAWRKFRRVIHWCAALAYQSRAFKSPFPQLPEIGYVGEVVILDFLALGRTFLAFAKAHVDFPPGQRPSFWTTQEFALAVPRQAGWPDTHMLMGGIELGPEFLTTASDYVVETDRLNRDWLVSGPRRRFKIARDLKKRS